VRTEFKSRMLGTEIGSIPKSGGFSVSLGASSVDEIDEFSVGPIRVEAIRAGAGPLGTTPVWPVAEFACSLVVDEDVFVGVIDRVPITGIERAVVNVAGWLGPPLRRCG
jgi:hypothetical protein